MADVKGTILVVDDEPSMRRFFEVTLKREGYSVLTADGVRSGLAMVKGEDFDLVLSDIKLGDGQGLEILAACKERDSDIPVIMMTAYASPETAVEAMKLGAIDYLTKPFNVDEVRVVVRNNIRTRNLIAENRKLKEVLEQSQQVDLVYKSDRMRKLIDVLRRVSKMDTTILVSGESGTGKELIMKTIHKMSPRHEQPYISVNCGALPESLFESELFGYEKGSFTGAEQRRIGLFESARGGTLFLDEIGEMPLKMQIKLLRVLQEKKIRRVGGTEEISVDFRLVAATNRDLAKEVQEGNFREDLYYRINVVPILLPPLRERCEDIIPLVRFFLEKFASQYGEAPKDIKTDALAMVETYSWPGNVRELENTIERIVALTPGNDIGIEDLPEHIRKVTTTQKTHSISIPETGMDLEHYLDDLRFRFMELALEKTNGVQNKSCELLGMSFRSFRYYLGKGKERGYFAE
ncbi:Sigma-54-dependent Fis family transcriptional regulator [Sulfidibacter corallicola]|uniref:Sigma-54-dependent Fis family transcriptional regulator n=1 Tax=Sulfidibacter corallicola TaxID=2818388 RepID=A0A8A4U2P8_SULCO|nr:sigma-54 dependent transcriptional regulator [Sulfidibacter corallicola]QTD53005.1 sigma-54-dependent Fis family transcriptional regulator [Sulfidibacter corallicola]